ncbi:MAG: COG1361 S-layer family protein [Candidatus Woesearchaeota archaeon]
MKQRWIMIALVLVVSMSMVSALQSVSPDIRITQISQTPDPVEPGDYVDLRFRVDNLGAPASSFDYEIVLDYPFSLDPGVPRRISVGTADYYRAAVGDGATIFWRVRVASDAVPGDRNTVSIRFYPREGDDRTFVTKDFPVRIAAQEGLLIVRDATINPEEVAPGRRFSVSLDLENLGTSAIRNVRVTSNVEGTPFSPYGSANERLVRLIGSESTRSVDFEFFTSPGVSLGVERLPFTIAYTDSLGTQYTLPATVGIPIDEAPSFLLNLESSNVYVPGTRGEVVVSVSNTGSSPLNFVVLSLAESDSYEVIGQRQTYLGNLQSDDFETGQFRIFVDGDAESLDLDFTVSYRTAFGEQRVDTRSVSVPLYTRERAQELGLVPAGNGRGMIMFVVLLLVIVGGFVWYRRKCKSR